MLMKKQKDSYCKFSLSLPNISWYIEVKHYQTLFIQNLFFFLRGIYSIVRLTLKNDILKNSSKIS